VEKTDILIYLACLMLFFNVYFILFYLFIEGTVTVDDFVFFGKLNINICIISLNITR